MNYPCFNLLAYLNQWCLMPGHVAQGETAAGSRCDLDSSNELLRVIEYEDDYHYDPDEDSVYYFSFEVVRYIAVANVPELSSPVPDIPPSASL